MNRTLQKDMLRGELGKTGQVFKSRLL